MQELKSFKVPDVFCWAQHGCPILPSVLRSLSFSLRPGKPATKVTGMTGERAGQNGVAGNLGTARCCVSATCQL